MPKVGCLYREYLGLHHHLFQVVALKELKLHKCFAPLCLWVLPLTQCPVLMSGRWCELSACGLAGRCPCSSFVTQLWSALLKKKSIENPGFRELVQAWLLILTRSCTLDMTLALQCSFKSRKAQCSPRHGYGFQCSSLQLCRRMEDLTAQPHPFTYQAFFSGPVLPWMAHSINRGCSCPVYPLGSLLHQCRL